MVLSCSVYFYSDFMCSPGWQQKYDKVEKMNEPFRDDASPRHGVGPKVLHNTNFLPSSRYTSPVLFMKYFVLFPPSIFLFFFIPFPLALWAALHSLVIIHLKLMSVHFCKCRMRFSERKVIFSISTHTAIGMKALWWMPSLLHCPIFSYSFQRVKCRSAATLVIYDTSYSQAVHLNTKGGERGGEGRREERKGRRTGHTGEKAETGTGVGRRARF